jgi:hypothetical protein
LQHIAWAQDSQLGVAEMWSEPQPFIPVPDEPEELVPVLFVVAPVVVMAPPAAPWPPVPAGPSTTTLPPQATRKGRKKEARFTRASY